MGVQPFQLHGDVADRFFQLGDHHILQRVDAAAGLLDLVGKHLAGLFLLRQGNQLREHVRHGGDSIVQLSGGLGHAIGQADRFIFLKLIHTVYGYFDRENASLTDCDGGLSGRIHQGLAQSARLHHRAGKGKILHCQAKRALHLQSQAVILSDQHDEAAHQLIPLVFEQLVAPLGCSQAALHPRHFHARGVYVENSHYGSSPLSSSGRYASSSSSRMRLSSVRGSIFKSFHPRLSVSSMERFV